MLALCKKMICEIAPSGILQKHQGLNLIKTALALWAPNVSNL